MSRLQRPVTFKSKYDPRRSTTKNLAAYFNEPFRSSKCRVPGDCAKPLARLGGSASSEADVKIAAPTITFGPQHAPSTTKCSPRVRIEAGRNAEEHATHLIFSQLTAQYF